MRSFKTAFLILSFILVMAGCLFAGDAVIIYTGQTHAMLYPCSCPIRQDGGISRRAALVGQLRQASWDLLLLDCGNFTAGGRLDEYSQNVNLDQQRSQVNYRALELMQYDAVAIGTDEFNFGRDFFLQHARKAHPAYLSANLDTDKAVPYIIKNCQGIKIAVIGLTGAGAGSKAEGLKVSPADAQQLNQLIGRLKAEGVQVVALLSTQGEKEDLKLAEKVKGLDIIFVGDRPLKDEPLTKVGMSFFLRPSWQGRKLGKLTLKMKDGKLADCLLEEIPLTDKIADAADITAILPACFTDTNCKDKELTGTCRNPGTLNAACEFVQPEKANVTVISMKDCRSCNPEAALDRLRKKLPGLSVTRLDYADADAQKAAKEAGVSTLPAFIFTKQIESVSNFDELKDDLQPAGDFYLLKPKASGIAYFLNRTASPGSFDLFFSIYWDKAALLLTTFKEFNPALHFLATYAGRDFVAGYGTPEVQEYLRAVCVQKYYPKRFWDYLACRAKDIHSSWWEDCLEAQQDPSRIKKCAQGREGVELLKENTALNKELELFSGPSYLLDNQMIFASKGVPERAEFRKILNKKSSK